jgi:hypothetical protein
LHDLTRLAVAALCDAAAKLCSGHAKFVAQNPQQRGIVWNVDLHRSFIERKFDQV